MRRIGEGIMSVSYGHFRGALLVKGSLVSLFVSCTDRDGVDAGGKTISCTGVKVESAITSCPDVDRSLSTATLQ